MAPDQAYDQLLALLVEGPLTAPYPLPTGGFEERTFGLGDLEVVDSLTVPQVPNELRGVTG